jgi:eukaryotic-like serine/threonine-protein kinase
MIIDARDDETLDHGAEGASTRGPSAPARAHRSDASTVKDSASEHAHTESGVSRDSHDPDTVPSDPPFDPCDTSPPPPVESDSALGQLATTPDSANSSEATLPADAAGVGVDGAASGLESHFGPGDRFRPVRQYASGGIGLVWVAQDNELQREVALKVIQPRFSTRADQRARFLLEAEITGKLEHPGIVPVYSLGRDAEGRPYYAMRFIRGESLAAAIRRFHKRRGEETNGAGKTAPPTWGVEFRQLLGSFLDVCDTIDYAHSRGVLHRDLKPSNIMLGPYGETLVVDWGLAKVIGETDAPQGPADAEFEPNLAGTLTAPSGETVPGTAMGTPSYMSPEQAAGQIDQIGPASDVYSLGATLYELVTGKMAFPGDKMAELLEKVRKGEFPPPRSIERTIPPALEAICLKAMALGPTDRFPSARALAGDIEHWLADEPVSAYPERPLERMARWLRQHRTWTIAAVAGLVGICLVTSIALFVVDGARRSEADARREAQTNFIMAQDAVNDYLINVSENTLFQEQDSLDMRKLRHQLLSSALDYYRRFVNQRSKDPALRKELANAYYRLGKITEEIGSANEAAAAFESALTNLEQLVAAEPKNDELLGELGASYLALGRLEQQKIGDLQAALQSLAQARAILEPLAARQQSVAKYQADLAECLSQTGVVQARLGNSSSALTVLEQARSIFQQLIALAPEQVTYTIRLFEVINNIGYVHEKRRDYAAELKSFQEIRAICETLFDSIKLGPKPSWLLNRLAKTDYNIGTLYLKTRELDKALSAFEQSLSFRSQLAAAHPSVTDYQENVGKTNREIGWLLQEIRQFDKSRPYVERSIEIFRQLVQAHPDRADFQSHLGLSLNSLGCLHDEARDNAKALVDFQQALAAQEKAANASSEVSDYKVYLNIQLQNVGEQYIDLGQIAVGLPYYKRGAQCLRDLHAAYPSSLEYSLAYVDSLLVLANVQRHAGELVGGLTSFHEARQLLDRLASAEPANAAILERQAKALTSEAVTAAESRSPADAQPLLVRAVEVLTLLLTRADAGSLERESQSEALWHLARIDRVLNQPDDAARLDAQMIELWKGRGAVDLANLALKEVGQAVLIGYGKTPIPAPALAVRRLDLDLAAAHLGLAIANGYTDLAALKANRDFGILLEHDGLKSLVKQLEHGKQK